MVAEEQGPELVGGDDGAEGVEEVVPIGAARRVARFVVRGPLLLLPLTTTGLPLQLVGDLVGHDPPDVGTRIVGALMGRDLASHAD